MTPCNKLTLLSTNNAATLISTSISNLRSNLVADTDGVLEIAVTTAFYHLSMRRNVNAQEGDDEQAICGQFHILSGKPRSNKSL